LTRDWSVCMGLLPALYTAKQGKADALKEIKFDSPACTRDL